MTPFFLSDSDVYTPKVRPFSAWALILHQMYYLLAYDYKCSWWRPQKKEEVQTLTKSYSQKRFKSFVNVLSLTAKIILTSSVGNVGRRSSHFNVLYSSSHFFFEFAENKCNWILKRIHFIFLQCIFKGSEQITTFLEFAIYYYSIICNIRNMCLIGLKLKLI